MALTVEQAKRATRMNVRVAKVMADGRERTTGDVAQALGIPYNMARWALRRLVIRRTIRVDLVDKIRLYQCVN